MAHLRVYITDEGLAEIDGGSLVSSPGRSVHEVVSGQLQRYAEERDAAVEAMVSYGPGAAHFVLQVSPDGSSRVLDPGEAPAPEPEKALVAIPPASAIASAVARAMTAARTAAVPADIAAQIGRINALGAGGWLDEAFAEATALRESLTGSVGAEHPHAVEARAVEAYLAHLRGDHRESVVLALAVARIRCGAGDDRAATEVARAAAAWQQLDGSQAAVTHGRELLHMWGVLNRRGQLPLHHVELAEEVHRRVEALEATYARPSHHVLRGPAEGPPTSGHGRPVRPCQTDDLGVGAAGSERRRWRRR